MTSFAELLKEYSLEVEALLTWYPIKSDAQLKEVKIRSKTIRHAATEFKIGPFGLHNAIVYTVGENSGRDDEDNLALDAFKDQGPSVFAFISITLNQDELFKVDLELKIGSAERSKQFILHPSTIIPFMINLKANANDRHEHDTAAVLQGVFYCGSRRSFEKAEETRKPNLEIRSAGI